MSHYEQVCKTLAFSPETWLITGVAGFIGSNLLETLLKLNQRVVGLDNFATGYQRNLDEVRSLVTPVQWQNFTFIEGDIRNLEDCQRAMTWSEVCDAHSSSPGAIDSEIKVSSQCLPVDFVLHQAAIGSVPRSVADPIAVNAANISGFLNVLVAARDARVKSFTYAASSSTYGDHPGLPKLEDQIGKPLSPYAVTKYVNELYADVFSRCYGFNAIGLRYFNVFGPRQDPNGGYAAVIPKWISSLINGEVVYINGDGETSRDFCYVSNVIEANLLAATAFKFSVAASEALHSSNAINPLNQIYNIALGEQTTLNELFYLLRDNLCHQRMVGKALHGIQASPSYRDFRTGDVRHSLADIRKAQLLLGYAPTQRIREGIKMAMPWYVQRQFLNT